MSYGHFIIILTYMMMMMMMIMIMCTGKTIWADLTWPDTVNGRSRRSKYKFAASEVVSTVRHSTNCEEKVRNSLPAAAEGQGRTKEWLSKGRVYTLQQLLCCRESLTKRKAKQGAYWRSKGRHNKKKLFFFLMWSQSVTFIAVYLDNLSL